MNTREALISVIVPVFNRQNTIRRCLDSIKNQTYKTLEIIVIDDGSIDQSYDICMEYAIKDKRISVLHQINGGVSSARNTGLNQASGDKRQKLRIAANKRSFLFVLHGNFCAYSLNLTVACAKSTNRRR